MGYKISKPKWQDKPDALVTLHKGKSQKRVAIEHTDYFNDTPPGKQSSLTLYKEFWKIVLDSLIRRISHRTHLTGISARVGLKKNFSKPEDPKSLARQLATELVEFAETHPVERSANLEWCSRDFDDRYPAMQSLVAYLIFTRGAADTNIASRSAWICSNVAGGMIGLALPNIKTAIENKNKKARNYNWDDANEKWLLIAASGTIVSNSAGPPILNVNWNDGKLIELCRNSPFDRIIFWERAARWYKFLKHDCPSVEYQVCGPRGAIVPETERF